MAVLRTVFLALCLVAAISAAPALQGADTTDDVSLELTTSVVENTQDPEVTGTEADEATAAATEETESPSESESDEETEAATNAPTDTPYTKPTEIPEVVPQQCTDRPEQNDHLMIPDPETCGRYIVCYGAQETNMPCPSGLYFNYQEQVCDWPWNTNCAEPDDA